MNRTIRIVSSALALGLALGRPARADEPTHATLQVQTRDTGEAREILQRRIHERGAVVLRHAKVLAGRSAADPIIAVTVADAQTEEPGYRYEITVTDEGAVVTEDRGECPLCTETELVELVEARLADVAKTLHELPDPEPAPVVQAPAPVVQAPVQPPQPEPRPPATDEENRGRIRAMGKAGIGVLAAGVASTAVGIGLLANPPSPLSDARYVRDTRPPGGALLGAGVLAIAVGGTLLGLDLRRTRQTHALAPWWSGHAAGLCIGGRM